MSLTPMLLLLIAADPVSGVLLDINIARVSNDRMPVMLSPELSKAAELQVEWLNHAYKKNVPFPSDHVCSSQWLFVKHPELEWDRLFATFPDGLPEWLGSFDLARLCGNNTFVLDNIYTGGKNDSAVGAYLSSPRHRENLLDEDWLFVGIGIGNVTGGNFATAAYFGE